MSPTDTERNHRSFEFTYEAALETPPADAEDVRRWIPLPIDTPDQEIEDVRIEANGKTAENAIENGFGRSVCVQSHGEHGKPEGQPWGRGDAEWACDARYGNCTDFHSYFIGLARSKKIPARLLGAAPHPRLGAAPVRAALQRVTWTARRGASRG